MKRILLFIMILINGALFAQNTIEKKTAIIHNWIIYQEDTLRIVRINGDTLFTSAGVTEDTLYFGGINYWTLSGDTIKTAYNVKIDSSFLMNYNGAYLGYGDPAGDGYNRMFMSQTVADTVASITVGYTPGSTDHAGINLYAGIDGINGIDQSLIDVIDNRVQIITDSLLIVATKTKIDSGLYITSPDMSDTRVGFLMAWEPTTGNTFPTSASNVGDAIDSARAASPTAYTTWVRGTNRLYPATSTDTVRILANMKLPVATATTGIIYKAGNPWLHDFYRSGSSGNNIWLGRAGNLTLTGATSGDLGSSNIGIGFQVLYFSTTGNGNTAIGYRACEGINTGTYNVAIGYNALQDFGLTAGAKIGNIAIGFQALRISQPNYQIGIGYEAMKSNTTGYENIAIGYQAMEANTNGYQMTAVGYNALTNATSSYASVAIGNSAMALSTDSAITNVAIGNSALLNSNRACNVAVGASALMSSVLSVDNIAMGTGALQNLKGSLAVTGGTFTGSENIGIGVYCGDSINYSGEALGTGTGNVIIGQYAMRRGRTINKNVSIGWHSGFNNITGDSNVYVGNQAGYLATGGHNIFIGDQAGYQETGSNKLYIENSNSATPLIYGDFANDYVNIVSKLHIGTSLASPTVALSVAGDIVATGQITYDFKHLVAYLTAGSYTPDVVSNTPFKLAPGLTTSENDGLTFAGDTVTIITPGDYKLDMSIVFQGFNGDDFLFTVRKNGTVFTSGNLALSTTGAGNYIAGSWFYYFPGLVAGDDISFYLTNEGASTDPTFRAFKIYLEKKPE